MSKYLDNSSADIFKKIYIKSKYLDKIVIVLNNNKVTWAI